MTFDRFHVIKLMNERLDDLRENWPERPMITMPRRLSSGCAGCFYTGATTWRKTPPGAWNEVSLSTSLCNVPTCSRRSSQNSGNKKKARGLGIPARMVREKSQQHPATPSYGADPPSPCQGCPELLTRPDSPVEKWKASTEKSAACSPAPSASVIMISSNCVSTPSMKPNSNSSAKTELSRSRTTNFGKGWFHKRREFRETVANP